MKLAVILGTVREGRMTERLAKWVVASANKAKGVEAELVDLKDFPMPFFDEPASPRFNPNRQPSDTVQRWLAKVQSADAYVFVTPEYNHSIPGVLKNALDYVAWEMLRKPATIVAHGSVGGARATMHLKEILSEARAVVIPYQVALAGLHDKINADGTLSDEQKTLPHGPQAILDNALNELKWYSDALAEARAK